MVKFDGTRERRPFDAFDSVVNSMNAPILGTPLRSGVLFRPYPATMVQDPNRSTLLQSDETLLLENLVVELYASTEAARKVILDAVSLRLAIGVKTWPLAVRTRVGRDSSGVDVYKYRVRNFDDDGNVVDKATYVPARQSVDVYYTVTDDKALALMSERCLYRVRLQGVRIRDVA